MNFNFFKKFVFCNNSKKDKGSSFSERIDNLYKQKNIDTNANTVNCAYCGENSNNALWACMANDDISICNNCAEKLLENSINNMQNSSDNNAQDEVCIFCQNKLGNDHYYSNYANRTVCSECIKILAKITDESNSKYRK